MAATFRLLLNISVLTTAGDAQAGPDLDPAVIGSSNPYPPRGWAESVAVRNGIAYCAVGSNLAIFDVRDPVKPVWVSARSIAGATVGDLGISVALFGSYVCFGHGAHLSIFDVKDPTEPRGWRWTNCFKRRCCC